jgi:hypothetical protein
VTFQSIYPACYPGRWPHIHLEVYPDLASATDDANKIATSQVALPEDACVAVYATDGYDSSIATLQQVSLEADNVFGDDGGESQLGTMSGGVDEGYIVELAVRFRRSEVRSLRYRQRTRSRAKRTEISPSGDSLSCETAWNVA